ncbi:hypothetical protein TIFTF001_027149 [Ficus carica]|uniref:Uncharacterized protein n=1 Tax=Ficus carica TaxID=3494 RepID=A0AA88DMH8_FICCA|nr:hypothetical protein TIFTF001_027149 [Ficus carica]
MKASVQPPGLNVGDLNTADKPPFSENTTRRRSRRTRAPDQILPSHQGDPEYSDQIVLRAPYLGNVPRTVDDRPFPTSRYPEQCIFTPSLTGQTCVSPSRLGVFSEPLPPSRS